MLFQDLATYFQKLEQTASRNEMTEILSELFKKVSDKEIDKVCYLSLGRLKPAYEAIEFNMAERTIAEVLSRYSSLSKEDIKKRFSKAGDWGDLAEELIQKKKSRLSVYGVYDALYEIALIEGLGSQEIKIERLKGLLCQLNFLSAKYVLRVILKKLRLGFSDMTILDALSWMEVGTKELRSEIEAAYNISADIGRVSAVFKKEGLSGLEKLVLKVGIPIRSSAAERLPNAVEIFKRLGVCYLEPKIDGFRLQVHLNKEKKESIDADSLFEKECFFVRMFSRNLEDMSKMFPEIKEAVTQLNCQSLIVEGEAVAFDWENNKFLSFQKTISRKRKYGISDKVKEIPLTLFIFDLLYLNGKSLVDVSFFERRKILENLISSKIPNLRIIEQKECMAVEDIDRYFRKRKKEGFEGIVLKMKDAPYRAGSRGFHWIKYKRTEGQGLEDSIDVVVLGYYYGKGRRLGFGIGALLVGVYNEKNQKFESIAKIGTGIKDDEFIKIREDLDKIKLDKPAKNVIIPKGLNPDVWVSPQIVAVVLADEITRSPLHAAGAEEDKTGFALRFPRLIEWNRRDKNPTQITTVLEIKSLFKNQMGKGLSNEKKILC